VTRGRMHVGALCLAVGLLAGCGSSPKVTFYTLSAGLAPEGVAAAGAKTEYRVAIGPVTLPDVVDRPQLVLRVGENRVAIAEQHRWAEPLKSEIPRVLAENLAQLLGTRQVSVYPQSTSGDAEYRALVDFQRVESVLGETVTIDALWTVRRTSGGEPRRGRSLVRESIEGDGYDALVAAHSRALAKVSRDLAEAIRGF
jgi:uncharacterized lipoprotein YmbA